MRRTATHRDGVPGRADPQTVIEAKPLKLNPVLDLAIQIADGLDANSRLLEARVQRFATRQIRAFMISGPSSEWMNGLRSA
jgi:hypothetical protein